MKNCSKFENSAGHWSEKISYCKTAWDYSHKEVSSEKEIKIWEEKSKYPGYLDNVCFIFFSGLLTEF